MDFYILSKCDLERFKGTERFFVKKQSLDFENIFVKQQKKNMEKILSQPPIIEMKKKMKRKLLKRFFINKSADV